MVGCGNVWPWYVEFNLALGPYFAGFGGDGWVSEYVDSYYRVLDRLW